MSDLNTTTFTVNVTPPASFGAINDLDVRLVLSHPALAELRMVLVSPGGARIPLMNNPDGTGAATGIDMGFGTGGVGFGTYFDQESTRTLADGAAPYIGRFRPSTGANPFINLSTLYGTNVAGTWSLEITDTTANNVGFLRDAALIFTDGLTATSDTTVATTVVRGTLAGGGLTTSAAAPNGIGPSPVIASDNTLGSFSRFQGRLYVAYVDHTVIDDPDENPLDNTDIFLSYSDNGGASWTSAGRVNDDSGFTDGFSGVGRPQFQPNLTVDNGTGAVVASFYDTRYDAARARSAYTVGVSMDGGTTFAQTFMNRPQEAFDLAAQRNVVMGPIPENPGNPGLFSYGTQQGLAVQDGQIFAAWSANENGGDRGLTLLDMRGWPAHDTRRAHGSSAGPPGWSRSLTSSSSSLTGWSTRAASPGPTSRSGASGRTARPCRR